MSELMVQIDGTFYANIHHGLKEEAKKRSLPLDSEETMQALLRERDLSYHFRLHLRPIIHQVIGCGSAAFDFPLMPERRRVLQPGGGSFAPNVYLAAGGILHLSEKPLTQYDLDDEPGLNIILNCGLPVMLGAFMRGGSSGAPGIARQNIKEDAWVAALGYLAAWPSSPVDEHTVRCRVLRPSIFDLNPASETFGTVILWSFAKKAPADADVFSIPVTLLALEVLGQVNP